MILFLRPSDIIMIASLIENGKNKVGRYWPSNIGEVFCIQNFKVGLLEEYEGVRTLYQIELLLVTLLSRSISLKDLSTLKMDSILFK